MGAWFSSFLFDGEDQQHTFLPTHRPALEIVVPQAKYFAFWENEWPARDAVVKLYAKPLEGLEQENHQEPLLEVKCHKFVIQEGSQLIRQQLEACGSSQGDQLTVIPLMIPANLPSTQEGAAAVEAVICFCYTHKLPEDTSVGALLNIATAAQYMDSQLCVKACLKSLSNASVCQLSASDVHQLLAAVSWLPDMDAAIDTFELFQNSDAAPASNLNNLQPTLQALFGHVDNILSNRQLTAKFCKLSLRAVELWGNMDTLGVSGSKFGSENCIVAMLSQWWKQQPSRTQTKDTKRRLSALVRLPLLSSTYIDVLLPSQPWFEKPPAVHTCYKQICSQLRHAVDGPDDFQHLAGLILRPRFLQSEPLLRIVANIDLSLFKVSTLQSSRGACNHYEKWQGYRWGLGIVKEYNKCYELTVVLHVEIPRYMHKPKEPLFVSAAVHIECNLVNTSTQGHIFTLPGAD